VLTIFKKFCDISVYEYQKHLESTNFQQRCYELSGYFWSCFTEHAQTLPGTLSNSQANIPVASSSRHASVIYEVI